MNLFDVYPHLRQEQSSVLQGRSLRLISISGIVYDDDAFYFEMSSRQYWARTANGTTVGIGGAKIRPDAVPTSRSDWPIYALGQTIRKFWGCKVDHDPAYPSYILQDGELVTLASSADTTPFLMIMTPPRLGGGDEVPDALAQAVYLFRLRHRNKDPKIAGLLHIKRRNLGDFFNRDMWNSLELLQQPWATLEGRVAPPRDAAMRPILALRGLQQLWRMGIWPAQAPEAIAS